MKPYYWESDHGNFGDDLNLWLWDFLLPGFRDVHSDVLLVGVGTVLNKELLPDSGRKLVLGSGFGYGTLPDMSNRDLWDIRSVRGPLTAQKVGVDESLGIIDPAVMVAEMPEFQHLSKIHKKSYVPHWESALAGVWSEVCATVGINYIDPRGEAKDVISAIARSELIIAESMHGAILADAFRVPWVAVSTSRNINSFKWNDWAGTLGVTYKPRHVPVSSRAEAIMKGSRFWGVEFEAPQASVVEPAARPQTSDGEVLVRQADTTRKSGLRLAAKQVLAVRSALALWQASRAEPQLSTDRALSERKERFLSVLDGVRRDYF